MTNFKRPGRRALFKRIKTLKILNQLNTKNIQEKPCDFML